MNRRLFITTALGLIATSAWADPNPPGNLKVTAISTTQLDLTWVDTNTTEEGYIIDRATAATGPYDRIGTVPPDTTIFRDTGLQEGIRYFYQVYAAARVIALSPPSSADGTTNTTPIPPQPGPGGLNAYVDPTDGDVPIAREVRADGKKLSFPSAQGWGRFAGPDLSPGHNTAIMKITNTNDSGTGSLRACWTGTGPRLCLPTVSGTITLTSDMLIKEANSNVYVAGQTSPGGLQVTVANPASAGPFRSNRADNVVVRFMHGRVGTNMKASQNGQNLSLGGQRDATTGKWLGRDIMVDHFSGQWGTDENISLVGVTDATLQWSHTSEPLACGPCRDDGATQHDFSGAFLVTNGTFTMHHNFIQNGTRRMPNIAGNSFDVINNISYNWKTDAGIGYVGNYPAKNSTIINAVGNWFGRGPRTINSQNSGAPAHCFTIMNEATPTTPGVGGAIYVAGNICSHDLSGQNNSRVVFVKPGTTVAAGYSQIVNSQPVGLGLSMQPDDWETGMKKTMAWAGARRDAFSDAIADPVDSRSWGQLLNCGNRNYSPPPTAPLSAVPAPGFPDLTQASWSWSADSDNDGIMDSYELRKDFKHPVTSLAVLTRNGDHDGDGWSDLEEFLNYYAGEGREVPMVDTLPVKNCGYPAQ